MSERCAYCEPLPDKPLSEGHVAVRFGAHRFVILLNGEDVSMLCPEAMGGEDGWAILYTRLRSDNAFCGNGRNHAFAERVHGSVQVLSRHD